MFSFKPTTLGFLVGAFIGFGGFFIYASIVIIMMAGG